MPKKTMTTRRPVPAAAGGHLTLTPLQKAALITTGAAAAFKILLWSLGASIDAADSWIVALRVIFAALSFVGFDLVLVAIVVDQRRYGATWDGIAAAGAAAIISALIALDVARVVDWPVLHGAPAALLLLFAVHLMLPRRWSRAAELRRLVRRLITLVRQERAARAELARRVAAAEAVAHHGRATPPSGAPLVAIQMNYHDAGGAPERSAGALPAQLPAPDDDALVEAVRLVRQEDMSVKAAARRTGASESTLRRRLAAPRATEERAG